MTPSLSVPTTPCAWRQYTLVFSDGDDCDRARDRIKDNHAAIAGDPFGAEEARTDLLLGTEDLSEKKSSRQSMYFFFFGFRRRFGGGWPSVFSMSKGKIVTERQHPSYDPMSDEVVASDVLNLFIRLLSILPMLLLFCPSFCICQSLNICTYVDLSVCNSIYRCLSLSASCFPLFFAPSLLSSRT